MISGVGAVTAFGDGFAALERAVLEARSGLSPMARFDVGVLAPFAAAGWLSHRHERGEPASAEAWAREAALEAVAMARIDPRHTRVGVVVGTTEGDRANVARIAHEVREGIGASGPAWTISTACASSTDALGVAIEWLDADRVDAVVVAGAESLVLEMFAGFAALGVLARGECAPFGDTRGTSLGEGAGALVVERDGVRPVEAPFAYLAGVGLAADAYHETSPDPRGDGVRRALVAAMTDAGVGPDELEVVNCHATGTEANDLAEWRGIEQALGADREVLLSASKSQLGHAQGAAGILELLAGLAAARHGRIAPSLRVGGGRRGGPTERLRSTCVPHPTRLLASVSAAFGGANAVAIASLEPRPRASRVVRSAHLLGTAYVDATHLERWLAQHDTRNSDPATRLAVAAAAACLGPTGIKIRGALRDASGVVGGVARPSPSSVRELEASLARGLDKASAPAFARIVAHAPFGAVARSFALRGPLSCCVSEGGAGIHALARAMEWIRSSRADLVLVIGVEEGRDTAGGEGSAFACLIGHDSSRPLLDFTSEADAPLLPSEAGTCLRTLIDLRRGRVESAEGTFAIRILD